MNKPNNIDYSSVKNLPELMGLLRRNGVPENEIWLHLSKYQEKKARELGIPMHGQFELTPLCNLDCKMCYVHLNKDQLQGSSLLTVEQWKSIMSQAHEMGMMNATLTGGECLTYPGFDELYLFLRNLGVKTSIKTNGLLLDDERIRFFNNYPPRDITVSLYGSSNEAYQNVAGHAVFDVIYNNLLHLKNVSYPVNIGITPSSYMYEDIYNILRLISQLNFTCYINVALFQPREETGRKICDLSNEEYIKIFQHLIRTNSSNTTPDHESAMHECGNNSHLLFGVPCGAGRSFFTVNWHGLISACDNLNSIQISLFNSSFSEAWKKIHTDAIKYPLPIECLNCRLEKYCFNCIAYRCNGAKSGHCNPKVCERTKLYEKLCFSKKKKV